MGPAAGDRRIPCRVCLSPMPTYSIRAPWWKWPVTRVVSARTLLWDSFLSGPGGITDLSAGGLSGGTGDHLNLDFIRGSENQMQKFIHRQTKASQCIKVIHIPTERPGSSPGNYYGWSKWVRLSDSSEIKSKIISKVALLRTKMPHLPWGIFSGERNVWMLPSQVFSQPPLQRREALCHLVIAHRHADGAPAARQHA